MEASNMTLNNEAAILSRSVDADNGSWSIEIAQGMLSLEMSPADRRRMNELAAKARDGSLTSDDELEIESYRQVSGLLELIRAKARASLRQPSSEPA